MICGPVGLTVNEVGMARRDTTVPVRVAEPLKQALQREAESDGRSLSSLVRNILVAHAAARVAEQAQAA